MTRPRILVVNDDNRLLETRRLMLEDCGAEVLTARGSVDSVREAIDEPVDLIVIDGTNVGIDHSVALCSILKQARPTECLALLITRETSIPSHIAADKVIHRDGPRRMLVELNELVGGRLEVSLWGQRSENENRSGTGD